MMNRIEEFFYFKEGNPEIDTSTHAFNPSVIPVPMPDSEQKHRQSSGKSLLAIQIAVNSGEDGSIVVGKISENETYAFDYDAQEGQYGDLVSKGIIDPTKVSQSRHHLVDGDAWSSPYINAVETYIHSATPSVILDYQVSTI